MRSAHGEVRSREFVTSHEFLGNEQGLHEDGLMSGCIERLLSEEDVEKEFKISHSDETLCVWRADFYFSSEIRSLEQACWQQTIHKSCSTELKYHKRYVNHVLAPGPSLVLLVFVKDKDPGGPCSKSNS